MRQSLTESLFLKPRSRDQAVRSADRFAKMTVSPRRNAQFAAGSERRSRFLNDPNEEICSLEPNRRQDHRSGQVEMLSTSEIMD